ncbi:hypothetical protein Tco_0814170 [Tanacetum coccineum]
MQLIQKLRDDQKCMKKFKPSSRSKATEDIISIGSFVEVLVLNHYVLVRKILGKLSKLQDEDAQNKTNIQEPRKLCYFRLQPAFQDEESTSPKRRLFLTTVGFNSLVHSFRALSTLRRSDLRMASAAAKPRISAVAAAGQRHVNSQPYAHTSYS